MTCLTPYRHKVIESVNISTDPFVCEPHIYVLDVILALWLSSEDRIPYDITLYYSIVC